MTDTERAEGSIVKDTELKAINSIVKQLNGMDATERGRVLTYIWNRYGSPAKPENGQ